MKWFYSFPDSHPEDLQQAPNDKLKERLSNECFDLLETIKEVYKEKSDIDASEQKEHPDIASLTAIIKKLGENIMSLNNKEIGECITEIKKIKDTIKKSKTRFSLEKFFESLRKLFGKLQALPCSKRQYIANDLSKIKTDDVKMQVFLAKLVETITPEGGELCNINESNFNYFEKKLASDKLLKEATEKFNTINAKKTQEHKKNFKGIISSVVGELSTKKQVDELFPERTKQDIPRQTPTISIENSSGEKTRVNYRPKYLATDILNSIDNNIEDNDKKFRTLENFFKGYQGQAFESVLIDNLIDKNIFLLQVLPFTTFFSKFDKKIEINKDGTVKFAYVLSEKSFKYTDINKSKTLKADIDIHLEYRYVPPENPDNISEEADKSDLGTFEIDKEKSRFKFILYKGDTQKPNKELNPSNKV